MSERLHTSPTHRPRRRGQRPRHARRGAAFLIAIAILVILVAIGTTFFSVSRLELKSATNVTNAVRVDLLNDAANMIAIHHLNQMLFRNPEVTSQDHSYRSLFNGAAFAGKSWARRKDVTADPNDPNNPANRLGRSLINGGVPELDINRIQTTLDSAANAIAGTTPTPLPVVLYWPEDGHKEQLFRGPRSNNWLYIPRFQSSVFGAGFDPFYPIVGGNAAPDFILLYDYDGPVDELRANPLPDSADRRVELRIEDGSNGGLGTRVAATPNELAALNNEILSQFPNTDIQFQYFSDLDVSNNDLVAERRSRYPFVTPAIYRDPDFPAAYGENPAATLNPTVAGYPEEQIDQFTDVDNDGDGLKDAIWIPIPEDVYFPNDLIDNDLDGLLDETQDNGLNEDGDFAVDANGNVILDPLSGNPVQRTDYQDWNFDGTPVIDPADGVISHDPDEAIEAGTFVYHGLGPLTETNGTLGRWGDGLDNDGNGLVDDPAEDKLFLTAPLPGVRIPIDLDGDGVASAVETFRPTDPVTGNPLVRPYRVLNPAIILPPQIEVLAVDQTTGARVLVRLTNADVDVIDNDHDLLVNDFYAYAYLGPYQPIDTLDPLYGWRHQGNWAETGPEFASPGQYAAQINKSYEDISRRVWYDAANGPAIVGVVEQTGNSWTDLLDNAPPQRDNLLSRLRVTHSGEPVCDIAGRAAITISDEAGKVNLNVAGDQTLEPFPGPNPPAQADLPRNYIRQAFGEGNSPREYDLRTLPDFDVALSSKIAGYRTGGVGGVHLPIDASEQAPIPPGTRPPTQIITFADPRLGPGVFDYAWDVSLPGYGRVDDNGTALLDTVGGRDVDGNGLAGEGLLRPDEIPASFEQVRDFRSGNIEMRLDPTGADTSAFSDPAQFAFAQKWFRLGSFAGIDEPAERQIFTPLRNELAEADFTDNGAVFRNTTDTPLDVADEVGELGDAVFQSKSELGNVNQIGSGTLALVDRFTTVNSSDRNVAFIPTETGLRALNKTDLNRASAKQLAAKLLLTSQVGTALQLVDRLNPNGIADGTPLEAAAWDDTARDPQRFAQGLRQANIRLTAFDPTTSNGTGDISTGGILFHRPRLDEELLGGAFEMPQDQILEYLQLAASIIDNRDADHGRSELATELVDTLQKSPAELGLTGIFLPPGAEFLPGSTTQAVANWPREASLQLAIADEALLPLEELEAHLEEVLGAAEGARALQITDDWWTNRVRSNTQDTLSALPDAYLPEQRLISYTAAGIESIRINELMVRPVRRVEAEAYPNRFNDNDLLATVFPTPPDRINLDPSPFGEALAGLSAGLSQGERKGAFPHPRTDEVETSVEYVEPGVPALDSADPLMPEFSVTRRALAIEYPRPGNGGLRSFSSPGVPGPAPSGWNLQSSLVTPLLGDDTVLATTGDAILIERVFDGPVGPTSEPMLVPDVLEFTFSDIGDARIIKGLPDGRYYLAVNMDSRGLPGDFKRAIANQRLSYAIKYHGNNDDPIAAPIARTIRADIESLLQAIDADSIDNFTEYQEYVNYFRDSFQQVPPQHVGNGPGEPSGWVFFDATPNKPAAAPGYFTDFPPSYQVTLNPVIPGLDMRVRVSADFDPENAPVITRPWRLRATGQSILAATSVQFTTLGAAVVSNGVAEIYIDNAQLATLMEGNVDIEVNNTILASADLLKPAAENLSSHAITIPPFETGFVISLAITTSNLPNPTYNPPPYDPDPLDPINESQGGFREPGGEIAINFFDFSQEPDHEYIEVANVSDEAVDLSGWELHIGPPKKNGVEYYPFNTEWLVPDGTTIAPGGMLLFAFNKLDAWDNPGAEASSRTPAENAPSLIARNGMGLARSNRDSRGDDIPDLSRVSVPPIADNSNNAQNNTGDPALNLYDPGNSLYYDPTGSVFDRPESGFFDYVDHYGAGVTLARQTVAGLEFVDPAFDGLIPDQQRILAENVVQSDPNGPSFNPGFPGSASLSNYPWDRIVELSNIRLWQREDGGELLAPTTGGNVTRLDQYTTVDDLARIVLRGGFLPNYPEQDGVDNDGDGGYLDASGGYVPGILDTDMIDNDLDGLIDERAVDIDLDGDGFIDIGDGQLRLTPTGEPLPVWPFSSEGVDEGRLGLLRLDSTTTVPLVHRSYGAGTYEFGTLPVVFNNFRAPQEAFFSAYNLGVDPRFANPASFIAPVFNNNFRFVVDSLSLADNVVTPLPSAFANPADWQPAAGPLGISFVGAPLGTEVRLPLANQETNLVHNQFYLIQVVVPNPSAAIGSFNVRLGSNLADTDPPFIPNRPEETFTRIVQAKLDPNQRDVVVVTADLTSTFDITDIRIIAINPSNTHGSSFAAGLSGDLAGYAAQSALGTVRIEGNANHYIGTVLGQASGSEGALNNTALPLNNRGLPVAGRGGSEPDAMYLGTDRDPPDWKAFVERRMYPGDNVVVSLYTASGAVADRVTYREYDVINRTIDDVVPTPYAVAAPGGFHDIQLGNPEEGPFQVAAAYASLHPDYPTMWLPNHMGLDFYRSLERKHPLETGDKFGTTNRWQATDGNYDDWSDSLSVFMRNTRVFNGFSDLPYRAEPALNVFPDPADYILSSRFYSDPLRDAAAGMLDAEDHLRLYGHALWGSPLRMNVAHRRTANPIDPLRLVDPQLFVNAGAGIRLAGDLGFSAADVAEGRVPATAPLRQFHQAPEVDVDTGDTRQRLALNLWQQLFSETPVINEPYQSPLDMSRVPHLTKEHHMVNLPSTETAGPLFTYLHDDTRLNYLTNLQLGSLGDARLFTNDITQRSVLAYHREPTSEGEPRPMTDLLDAGATDNIMLTVGQANFIPIAPLPAQRYPDGNLINIPNGDYQNLLYWQFQQTGTGPSFNVPAEPPAAWSPVFLFAFPEELDTGVATTGPRRFPFYPPSIDGRTLGTIDGNAYGIDPNAVLFDANFFFTSDWLRAFYPEFPPLPARNELLARWPLEKRVAMYVSKRRNLNPAEAMDPLTSPEALWVWDEEDGLENGEYEVYIGTFIPGLAKGLNDTVAAIDQVAQLAPDLVDQLTVPAPNATIGNAMVTQFAQNNIAARDPGAPQLTPASDPFGTRYEIDVLTDRIAAQGVRSPGGVDTSGLVPSSEWQPGIAYTANADGYIFYGADAANGWQPLIVRVTDNFLALRVRNAGTTSQTGAISHVVLSPRKRSPGRMNINTTQFQVAKSSSSGDVLMHPLAGLPGFLDLGGEIPLPLTTDERADIVNPIAQTPNADGTLVPPYRMAIISTLLDNASTEPVLPPKANPFGILSERDDPNNPGNIIFGGNLADLGNSANAVEAFRASRYLLLSLLQLGRTEYADGRYYKSVGDLVSEESAYKPPAFGPDDLPIFPLSNNSDAERRAREVVDRFRRIASSITVRSDVYEVTATVQSGYGIDANNDGRFNYRDPNEFITTAESRTRMVYERRAPADNSDIADVSKQ